MLVILFLLLMVSLQACLSYQPQVAPQYTIQQNDFTLVLPAGFDSVIMPEGNELSQVRVELGRKLFFDNALSVDSSLNCASCHSPTEYFMDGLPKSQGIDGQFVDRNSPTLFNVAYHDRFLREGGVPTLEQQVLVPIQEHREFNFNIVPLSERLDADSTYHAMAMEAYGRKLDPYVLVRAIAAYERTLISGNSAYDQFFYQGNGKAMTKEALKGYELFNSNRLKCAQCHSGFNFSSYEVVNNGLYAVYQDIGKARLTYDSIDVGKFKVPSLRNVEMTGPYMHDGSMKTLEEIIDHYAAGGQNHPNKSELITGFEISEKEKQQLIAFLRSLTDHSAQSLANAPEE